MHKEKVSKIGYFFIFWIFFYIEEELVKGLQLT